MIIIHFMSKDILPRCVADSVAGRIRVMPAVIVTGIALHLAEGAEPGGPHLENLILADLVSWRDSRLESCELFYWRSTIGEEVDFVIETGDRLLPIEVKASARPRLSDAKHLLTFRTEYGRKARAGLLLHTGKTLQWIAPDVLAAPWWYVL
jgi:predicted AAA+ superfamily ATPase